MKSKWVKKLLAACLAAGLSISLLAGCGGKGGEGDGNEGAKGGKEVTDAQKFTWWIYQTDGAGTYYEDYKDAAAVQWVNAQYWDTENGGVGTAENGTRLQFDYIVPISGNEQDNFNTMFSTGEYPELVDLAASSENPQAMVENGWLMDITEYVEEYMPNYLALLDANPELKPLVSVQGEDGSPHYYALYRIGDSVRDPWEGMMYRRDWLVEYAEPTEYVWDWDDEDVQKNGHPEVTPLSEAMAQNNLNGWKKNEVTEFTATPGENPDEDYTDNVIFPSGTEDPITISDWEWMFEAFDKAIADRGWSDDTNAYCTSISYMGNSTLGDIVSSFGGGNGYYYMKDGKASFDGTSENFATYVECMQNWYKKGWLDQAFYTRASDLFYMINQAGISQGKVGLWSNYHGNSIGTLIRQTCLDERDQQNAFAMPAALPINDMYGSEEQMYKEPDALYQDSRIEGKIGVTPKCEEKDLKVLFTFLDWAYTVEGAETLGMGLTEEQANSVELNPDLYAEYGITCSYSKKTDDEDKTVYVPSIRVDDPNAALMGATQGSRMVAGLALNGTTGEYYKEDGTPAVYRKAYQLWGKYKNTGGISDYTGLLSADESAELGKVQSQVVDYMGQNLPRVIMGEMKWEDYTAGLDKIDTGTIVGYIQKYVDLAK
ncbi:MAG: hypothetical protein HFH23_01385 [Ruminococcus sp.]|nr:hypothetical protein [Ruminococcus sp.]